MGSDHPQSTSTIAARCRRMPRCVDGYWKRFWCGFPTQSAGEREARIVDPGKVEVIETYGCEVAEYGGSYDRRPDQRSLGHAPSRSPRARGTPAPASRGQPLTNVRRQRTNHPNALEILFADERDWHFETPTWRQSVTGGCRLRAGGAAGVWVGWGRAIGRRGFPGWPTGAGSTGASLRGQARMRAFGH